MKKFCAEIIGTFTLVLFGCGTAIIAGSMVGNLGIAIAFGLSVLVMAYAVGHVSGGHFNPAVTIGVYTAKRMEGKLVIPYILSQLIGACLAATVIYVIVTCGRDGVMADGFAANTVQKDYTVCAAFLAEAVLTFIFLVVILGSTSKEANSAFAPIAIGLALTCIHLVSIPITNTSVNPARSTSQVLFSADPLAMHQLWLFWAAPILGAVIAGLFVRCCCCCCSGECAVAKTEKADKPAAKKTKK